jgi:ABC-type methionine transport system ATPase subunit
VVGEAEAASRLEGILELAGIDPVLLDREEDQLSVGQRQRVVLGRALMTRPRVLLLDEPTSALDPPGGRALLKQILRLGEAENLTLVMVTHRLRDARQFARTTVVLEGGRIVEQGPANDILSRLETEWDES